MSTVALYIFRTVFFFFSFLATVLYQSGDNHVLVYCAAYRKWCQINSKLEIRLVRTDVYWQYSFIWVCSLLRGLTSVLEYFIIQKYLLLKTPILERGSISVPSWPLIFGKMEEYLLSPNRKWGVWVAWSIPM